MSCGQGAAITPRSGERRIGSAAALERRGTARASEERMDPPAARRRGAPGPRSAAAAECARASAAAGEERRAFAHLARAARGRFLEASARRLLATRRHRGARRGATRRRDLAIKPERADTLAAADARAPVAAGARGPLTTSLGRTAGAARPAAGRPGTALTSTDRAAIGRGLGRGARATAGGREHRGGREARADQRAGEHRRKRREGSRSARAATHRPTVPPTSAPSPAMPPARPTRARPTEATRAVTSGATRGTLST